MQHKETLPVGTVLDSGIRQYIVKSVLGQGGFGITYLASSQVLVDNIPFDVHFAIKEHYIASMNERQGTSVSISNANNTAEVKESIESFLVEAKRLNTLSLKHSGIVRVNESFQANGTAYYVMEYIKGQSLREFVKLSKLGRLHEADALRLFRPVAETIGYLHENRVTHLDIKPDNILIRENGNPVIIDFGLAKHYNSKGTPTSTIKALGCSAGYSPMEQYVGITTFTPEADIYALGATLFFLLTGRDPALSTEICPSTISSSLPSDISDSTKCGILKAMEKLKENRTARVNDFTECLYPNLHTRKETILFEKSFSNPTRKIESTSITKERQQKQWHKSNRKWIIGGTIIIAIITLSVMLIQSNKRKSETSPIPIVLLNTEDSLSYAIGMCLSQNLKTYLDIIVDLDSTKMDEFKKGLLSGAGISDEKPIYEGERHYGAGEGWGLEIEEQTIPAYEEYITGEDSTIHVISKSYLMEGLIAGINHDYSIFNIDEAEEICQKLEEEVRLKYAEQIYGANKKAGETFLIENKKKWGVYVLDHESNGEHSDKREGVQYRIIKHGNGIKPSNKDSVIVRFYEGRLLDGTVFFDPSQSISEVGSKVEDFIEGVQDALVNMPVGSVWEIYIPQDLAYGAKKDDIIDPFSMLILKIELVSIVRHESDEKK